VYLQIRVITKGAMKEKERQGRGGIRNKTRIICRRNSNKKCTENSKLIKKNFLVRKKKIIKLI